MHPRSTRSHSCQQRLSADHVNIWFGSVAAWKRCVRIACFRLAEDTDLKYLREINHAKVNIDPNCFRKSSPSGTSINARLE